MNLNLNYKITQLRFIGFPPPPQFYKPQNSHQYLRQVKIKPKFCVDLVGMCITFKKTQSIHFQLAFLSIKSSIQQVLG